MMNNKAKEANMTSANNSFLNNSTTISFGG